MDDNKKKHNSKMKFNKQHLYKDISFADQQALECIIKNVPKDEFEYCWLKETIKERKSNTHFPWFGFFMFLLIAGIFALLALSSIDYANNNYIISMKLCDMTHSGKLINVESNIWTGSFKVICENATFIKTSEDNAWLRSYLAANFNH